MAAHAQPSSPVPEPSDVALTLRGVHETGTVSKSTYNELRRSAVLVEYDPEQGALLALLRFDGAERATTRDVLRRLGFRPNASPEQWSISWRRSVSRDELAAACRALWNALGNDVVLDLGARFAIRDFDPDYTSRLPAFWLGRFVLHVEGTSRCVVFDSAADPHDLARTFNAERAAYYANDFVPATE